MRILEAVPPFAGGKRRLLGRIFRQIPSPDVAPVLVDCFAGSGTVSLVAKARGYEVHANDCAERSLIIGRALLENDRVRLDRDDLVALAASLSEPGFAERELAPEVFTPAQARFLDTVVVNARRMSGPKRWLGLLLALRQAIYLRPRNQFGAVTIMKQIAGGDYESVTPTHLRAAVDGGRLGHPMRVAEKLRHRINRGVFQGARPCSMSNEDVFEFLRRVSGDILYADPPYAGTLGYGRAFRPLDELLLQRSVTPDESEFTTEPPETILPRFLEACQHFPLLILSYGSAAIDLPGLVEIVRRFRPRVDVEEIPYVHMRGLAGEVHRERNREFLIVARKR